MNGILIWPLLGVKDDTFVKFQLVMPKTVASLFFAWRNGLGKLLSKIWNMVASCLMWLVWREHNTCTCENNERPLNLLKSMLVETLLEWARIWGFTQYISISDFLQSVSFSS